MRTIQAGPFVDPAWSVPAFEQIANTSKNCLDQDVTVDVRGEQNSYARLSLVFNRSVKYRVIAWFDQDKLAPGLLIAVHADRFGERVKQSFNGFSHYAGFAKSLPQLKPEAVFAADNEGWCRIVIR